MTAPPDSADAAGNNLFARLAKTRRQLAGGLAGLFSGGGGGGIDPAALDDLHDHLLMADVGVAASERIINRLRRHSGGDGSGGAREALRAALMDILKPCQQPWAAQAAGRPFVVLMVGVNGVGKTTTAAKLAARLQREGRSVMLAACDTFRAAAVEQLQHWGRQLDIPVIAQAGGGRADAAAVAFDACAAARARGVDALIIDTAGRQHTDHNLMAQLQKITRVAGKADAGFPDDILLTVDAGTGHNALAQAAHFQRAVGLSGVCVAKLDGSAKGGMVVALAAQFGAPIRFVGTGQAAEDLRPFDAAEFVDALLPEA